MKNVALPKRLKLVAQTPAQETTSVNALEKKVEKVEENKENISKKKAKSNNKSSEKGLFLPLLASMRASGIIAKRIG